ncbi:hypothetical protein I553_9199 [Mycobacterium xenopi 4042]|uniref:Uncharacterized protein n=1 Tax=Mycobacterium xenopi 4042 TaxID=1299334 RepID=X8A7N1_MYCXE|nr:hypothetical protein I553_9199 [Mycobacterium xenopi 4042]
MLREERSADHHHESPAKTSISGNMSSGRIPASVFTGISRRARRVC